VRSALAGSTGERPWIGLLDVAKAAGVSAGSARRSSWRELELVPRKERRRYEPQGWMCAAGSKRRTRTRTLTKSGPCGAVLRDLLCLCEGAPELIYAVERRIRART